MRTLLRSTPCTMSNVTPTTSAPTDESSAPLKSIPNEFDVLYIDPNSQNDVTTQSTGSTPFLRQRFSMRCSRIGLSFKKRIRWIIFILTWFQLGSVMNCVDIFSFSMVYMENNGTSSTNQIYKYTMEDKSSLISAMAVGSLIGMYPQNILMQKYGARPVLTISSLLCAIVTAFMPWALDTHFHVALVFRIMQGILYSADFGVVGYVCSKWSPLNEVGISLATLSGFTACRSVVQLPLAGWVSSPNPTIPPNIGIQIVAAFGWRCIYYVLSLILVASTTIWWYMYRDEPEMHEMITNFELRNILHGRRIEVKKISIPHNEIVRESSVWAVWIAGFADIFASFVFLVYGAQYYQYLGLDIQANAWLNSIKGVLFIVVRILAGIASDRIKFIEEKTKLRVFNTISLQIPALFLVIVTCLPTDVAYLHIVCISVYQASFGFNCGGFYKGAALISRQFSYVVIGYIQLFKSLATLIEPFLFSLLVLPDKPTDKLSWSSYFLLHAIGLTVANAFFVYNAQDEPAKFVLDADVKVNKADIPRGTH